MTIRPFAALAAALALSACATQVPPPPPGIDYNVGIAKVCEASPVDLASGAATSTMRMSNDGWCAVRVTEADGKPYLLGLVRRPRPEHGGVHIQKIAGQTRIEYTAAPGFTGTDGFTVDLRSRTATAADAKLQVAVTVVAGLGNTVAAPAAAPPIVATPAATAPKKTTRHAAPKKTPQAVRGR